MVRIIVFGGWFGSGNIGDDAILIGLNNILTRVLPDAELVAISSDPDQTRRVCGVEAVPLLSPADVARTGGGSLRPYFSAFRDADACIVSGGTPFYDYGHVSRTLHFSLPVLRGKTIHCFGVGVKPIRSKLGGGLIRALVEQAESISTRDRLRARARGQEAGGCHGGFLAVCGALQLYNWPEKTWGGWCQRL